MAVDSYFQSEAGYHGPHAEQNSTCVYAPLLLQPAAAFRLEDPSCVLEQERQSLSVPLKGALFFFFFENFGLWLQSIATECRQLRFCHALLEKKKKKKKRK